jgi:uncharacterized protein (TIGR00255 family)
MTGFAARSLELPAAGEGVGVQMDLRGVNGRGLELRLRLPEGFEGCEAAWRALIAAQVTRGSLSLTLRLTRAEGGTGARLDMAGLDRALDMLATITARAKARGLALENPRPEGIATLRGVLESGPERANPAPAIAALRPELDALLAEFDAMRRAEGAALRAVLLAQLDQVAALVADARAHLPARARDQAAALQGALARLGESGADPQRLAQELALLAVKTDISEELDRLDAHVGAARELLDAGGPVGRRLDFLTQEFNREANTLCAKAQSPALTRIGLDLKAVIDQMREQVQNVE